MLMAMTWPVERYVTVHMILGVLVPGFVSKPVKKDIGSPGIAQF
jgi:hypothetical protein